MRKYLLLLFFLVFLPTISYGATLAAVGTPGGTEAVTCVTAVDNTTVYIGTAKGNVYSQHITTGARTKINTAAINESISSIVTDATYLYVGTTKGKVWRVTISGGGVAAVTCTLPGASVKGMKWDATSSLIWMVSNKGQLYTCTP